METPRRGWTSIVWLIVTPGEIGSTCAVSGSSTCRESTRVKRA
jgi:hypothetical protein